MADVILVLNAGSSSIKFRAFDPRPSEPELLIYGQVQGLYGAARFAAFDEAGNKVGEHAWKESQQSALPVGHREALQTIVSFLREHRAGHQLRAIGHRVVHGGVEFAGPVLATPTVMERLEQLSRLAPLHQPHNLAPVQVASELRPDLPQVLCFDTAFHRGQPEVAQAFALPASITRMGVRRYGFHGLSYEYIASRLPALSSSAARGRTVVAHLGNGASMCAMVEGKSVASTMGFTAVDGLPMGTRCGNLDPGVILFLMDELKMDARAIESLIYKQSGLLGVSGISGDMRVLLESDDPAARFAVSLYVYRILRELGSLAAAMQGLDALVFTGGIGEHASSIRERVCRGAAWLGLELDQQGNGNASHAAGQRISREDSRVQAWVIPTDEELVIARHTRALLGERA